VVCRSDPIRNAIGYPPFFSENPAETCQKIVQWRKYFTIPNDVNISSAAENLIRKLITSADSRINVEEIKAHPFFTGINWKELRKTKAPFIPDLSSDFDNKYFDKFEEQEPFHPAETKTNKRKDINFIDYEYKKETAKNKKGLLLAMEILETLEAVKMKQQHYTPKQTAQNDKINQESLRIDKDCTRDYISNNNTRIVHAEYHKKFEHANIKLDRIALDCSKKENFHSNFQSNSPDSRIDTNSNSSVRKGTSNKVLNVVPVAKHNAPIPLKKQPHQILQTEAKIVIDYAPNIKDKEYKYPKSARHADRKQIEFQGTKYTQKIYENLIKLELGHKSSSHERDTCTDDIRFRADSRISEVVNRNKNPIKLPDITMTKK